MIRGMVITYQRVSVIITINQAMNILRRYHTIVGCLFFFSLPLLMRAQSYVPEQRSPLMQVKPAVQIAAYPFPLKDVQLLDGPFKKAMEADARYLLAIEPDRLLADFRLHADLPSKGKRYGGWESSGLAGHTLGHYLSACSMQYAATGDVRFLEKVNYIVTELDECQKNRKTGYLGAIPKEDSMWSEVEKGNIRSRGFDLNGAWSPWYTVHKIMAGLLDAYLYCNNKKALVIQERFADWADHLLRNLNDSLWQRMLLCEYGGMNEALANTYALDGNPKYLALSRKFHDKRVLDSLALQHDVLPGKHSNTQIPKVIGCIRRYELTGEEKDKDIASFFWETVTGNHSYAPGGNSNYEYLGPPGQLSEQLTDNTMETCNTYNMLKLTRHLFALQPEARYMNFYEKALYNHILSSQNHETGMMCYFVPLRMGTQKDFSDSFNTFTCCVGSGMENHVKYGESIYSAGVNNSLYVNLYIASVLNWEDRKITVTQNTQLPAGTQSVFTINSKKTTEFAMHFRVPSWNRQPVQITINGKPQETMLGNNGYITIQRKWNNNDKVVVSFSPALYSEAMPDNPNRIALFYGPVVLAGVFGNKEPDPVTGIPVFVTSEPAPRQWIKADEGKSLVFHSVQTGQPADVTLIPFNEVQNEFYTVYWDKFTPAAWATQQKVYEEARKKKQEMEARTVDALRVGEMQPERDHDFTGDRTRTGEEHGQKWRSASPRGYFTFTMKTDPGKNNALLCTYWGMDNRGRTFDILVDGVKIATEDLNKYKASRFYEITYPIPAELTKGKEKVTITFQPASNNSVGPIYGTIRLIRE